MTSVVKHCHILVRIITLHLENKAIVTLTVIANTYTICLLYITVVPYSLKFDNMLHTDESWNYWNEDVRRMIVQSALSDIRLIHNFCLVTLKTLFADALY